jgi:hypothetical protein
MREPHEFTTPAWKVQLPFGVTSRSLVDPPADSDLTSMAVCWGRLDSGTWVRIVIGTVPRKGRTLRTQMRKVSGLDGRAVRVAGGHGARRAELAVERDEPIGGEAFDRVTVVVVAGRRELVSVAISATGHAEAGEIDAIVDSLRLLDT